MRPAIDCTVEIREFSESILSPPIPVPTRPNTDPLSPLIWWRTRTPNQFGPKDIPVLRWTLLQTGIIDEPHWSDAITGKVTAAINVAVGRLKARPINHHEIDLALSALLACAIDHDVTSGIVISSALRRRSKIDPPCRALSDLWLAFDL